MTKFERMNNNMLGNITVGIVIVLAVAACGLGVWLTEPSRTVRTTTLTHNLRIK